ncbi:MAG: hypothetical protein EOM80_10835 [Erysipelotrichia bacterium]|nr:hypothetical protein [Erysipelotrichia bacterium]
MSKNWTKLIALVTVFCMLFSAEVFAGKGYDQSCCKKKTGFFAKIGKALKKATQAAGKAIKTAAKKTGKAIKTAAIKTGKAIKVAGAKINNAVKDSGVWMKYKLLGCKNRVWVVGHYDKNGKWIKGHWRKLDTCGNNNPGQGNHPGQGNYPGQTEEPLPPVGDDPGMPGDDAAQPAPVPEDPVLPELPEGDEAGQTEPEAGQTEPEAGQTEPEAGQTEPEAGQTEPEAGQTEQGSQSQESDESEQSEQSGQSAQQSGDAKPEGAISLRTMGMLMNDLVRQSGEITSFKKTAAPEISFSMGIQTAVNSTYESREANANLLVKVIVWDLQQNKGAAGEYFSYFTYKMGTFDPESRKLIKDVLGKVREGVRHGVGHVSTEDEKAVYEKRLSDIEGF